MLQGEALRRRVSRVGDRVLANRGFFYKDCFGETPKPTRETHALPGTGKDAQSQSNEL